MKTASEAMDELEQTISALRAKLNESHLRTDRLREERDDARIKLRELQSGKVDVAGIAREQAEAIAKIFNGDLSGGGSILAVLQTILRSHLEGKSE